MGCQIWKAGHEWCHLLCDTLCSKLAANRVLQFGGAQQSH